MTKKQPSAYAYQSVVAMQNYMDKNPMAHKTCTELWNSVSGTSRSAVEKAFRSITGKGIKQYLVRGRLQYSKKYLKDGMPIKRIAIKTLYKSQSAYCTAFKRQFAQTPTDWLKDGQQ
jgi:AraC-like DNA-binding protein